ncbi:MAG: 16S rRNA processing protein RimM [Bacteroidales bacterium]|nr:16S rRNA processing protein RimM [Bacteroidales bacterium]
MEISQCYELGRITRQWGVKGQLVLFLDVDTPTDYIDLDSAFVELRGQLVPHFFHIDNINGNKAVATFEGITADNASSLIGHTLYLPLSMLPKLSGNKFYYHEVLGYRLIDKNHGDIGEIKDILDLGPQALFQTEMDGKEILIPIIDQIIKQVDREKRTISIEAPNGLIELYINDINK